MGFQNLFLEKRKTVLKGVKLHKSEWEELEPKPSPLRPNPNLILVLMNVCVFVPGSQTCTILFSINGYSVSCNSSNTHKGLPR